MNFFFTEGNWIDRLCPDNVKLDNTTDHPDTAAWSDPPVRGIQKLLRFKTQLTKANILTLSLKRNTHSQL